MECATHTKACRDVFGRNRPSRPPLMSNAATAISGTAQLASTRYPNMTLPIIAPSLVAIKVTAIPVDLKRVDYEKWTTYELIFRLM